MVVTRSQAKEEQNTRPLDEVAGHSSHPNSKDSAPGNETKPTEHQGQTNSCDNPPSTKKRYKDDGIIKMKYNVDINALRQGIFLGQGASGQTIRLKNSNIVVKQCDSYNNREGFKMLRN